MSARKLFPGFGFSITSELLLVEADTYRPLWYPDLPGDRLRRCLDAIPVEGGGNAYDVAGYQADGEPPKGVRLHTPRTASIEVCLDAYHRRYDRLQTGLAEEGWQAVSIAHHPIGDCFDGPKAGRGYEDWIKAMFSMATYDLKLEVSLPPALMPESGGERLGAKVNAYAPALAGLGLASPLRWGGIWDHSGEPGRSLRLYRHSRFGPAFFVEDGRFVFPWFDLTRRLGDLHAFFLLWVEALLDPGLEGKDSDVRRAYEMAVIAGGGLGAGSRWRAAEVLDRAFYFLPEAGLDPGPLEALYPRLENGTSPADEILALYRRYRSVPEVLRQLATLVPERTETVSCPENLLPLRETVSMR